MKKEITLGQLISVATVVLISVITGWITMNNKVSKLEVSDEERSKQFERLELKIDKNNEITTNILIELQNKADRPK